MGGETRMEKKNIVKGMVSVSIFTIVSCHDMWLLLSNNSFIFRFSPGVATIRIYRVNDRQMMATS